MGLKRMIRQLIPQQWEKVLKDERAISFYVETVYNGIGRKNNNNPEILKFKMKRIRAIMRESNQIGYSRDFWISLNVINFTLSEITYWEAINRKIQNYKESCA